MGRAPPIDVAHKSARSNAGDSGRPSSVLLAASVAVAIAAGALILPAPAQATSTDTTSGLGGLSVTRYGGADRYATSLLVAEAVTEQL